MNDLLQEIRRCTHCAECLPLGPKPIVSFSSQSKILLISQAPGTAAHSSGIPYHDPSGRRLREWLGVDEETFYNPDNFAILPMGFCYPGRGKSGDLPPRKECAPLWHHQIHEVLANVQLKLLIGQYAQKEYLGKRREKNLTLTVQNFKNYLPEYLTLPHPSPLNNRWLKKNPWFEGDVLPELRARVIEVLG